MTDNQLNALEKLSNTVHLYEGDDMFQFVYGTQLYDSMFSLYANFNARANGDLMEVEEITFIGVNYKGNINLGIKDISAPVLAGDGALEITVTLQADDSTAITPLKTVSAGQEVGAGNYLKIIRELAPMSDDYYDAQKPILDRAFTNGKFDSEYFVRDGLFIKERPKDWQMLRSEDLILQNPLVMPGSDCKFGISELRI
ncbi:MAG: hypothetical protein AAGA66_03690 [Bacteroidota bacterium]